MKRRAVQPSDPLWYKDGIFYEVRVRSFFDSSGDGIGDFAGLTAKLDYLVDLGVTALWLLPFYPSPLRDDGYDISDYMSTHPDCGSLADFKTLLREAHRRGLHVVTELIINHTSDQHPWFQRARRAPKGDKLRDYYVWSDSPDRFRDARIIFQDFEPSNWTWDTVAKSYYWHRFYWHQPDLNFDNPAVRREVVRVLDFWLGMGVDGLRLDAVPYLFERENTDCENLPETHAFLRELRAHVDRKYQDRMLLAEANQWPEDAAAYLAEGKECHMAFHFPLMPRIFIAVRMEDRFPIVDIWSQTPPIDDSCQWALFLRNHDELTLEMVSAEERDYMFRAYAREARMRINLGIRRRLAPLLGNNRRSIELVNGLLLSLPGAPVIYYGDEIGMGDNIYLGDRDGVRTPMQWSADLNAGFSSADPQRLILPVIIDHEYHYQTINVAAQDRNRHSLLWWMRRVIALRKQHKAFSRGSIDFLNPENPRVLVFIRSWNDEHILVVANLSRFKGMTPVELFGRTRFPPIGERPYLMTLGPHMFDWFSLEDSGGRAASYSAADDLPAVEIGESWERFMLGEERERLERVLPDYMSGSRWFRAKASGMKSARIVDAVPLTDERPEAFFTLVEAELTNGEPETYIIPLGLAERGRYEGNGGRLDSPAIAELRLAGRDRDERRIVFDAAAEPSFARAVYELMRRRRRIRGRKGELLGAHTAAEMFAGCEQTIPDSRLLRAEQTNSSVAFGEDFLFKLYRKAEPGISPEVEIGRFLAGRGNFKNTPPMAGWIEYRNFRGGACTIGVMHQYVQNQGDAWAFTRHELARYFERAAARGETAAIAEFDLLAPAGPDPDVLRMIGAYLDAARLLGVRVAEMHLALGAGDDSAFSPEPYSPFWQRSEYQSMRNMAGLANRLARAREAAVNPDSARRLRHITEKAESVLARFNSFLKLHISALRIRGHGDLHLGQVLHARGDFMIIDFEGEPARSLEERRRKRLAIRDVAGMLRSFDYAASSALLEGIGAGAFGRRDFATMEPWARMWSNWASWALLHAYLERAKGAPFLPAGPDELRVMLDAFILEKALYELAYELNNRPDWTDIPLGAIERIIGA